MKTYFVILNLTGDYLIRGVFLSVLVIIICRLIFKNKLDSQRPLAIVRWLLIVYAFLIIVSYLLVILFDDASRNHFDSAIGPYWYAFWIMLLSNTLLPLSLFFKRLQKKIYYIFFVGLLMNTGWLMESLVTHTMSIHRDYAIGTADYLPYTREVKIALTGIIEGVVIMIIGNLKITEKRKEQPLS
ncbi:MAG: hypothetical protein V4577_10540 [Bacteroidota bacterium]